VLVAEPVRDLRPGRELPRPPSFGKVDGALQAVVEGPLDAPWWRFPALSANHQLFFWFWLVVVLALGVPLATWLLVRRHGPSPARTALFVGSLFGLGMLGQAMQRPDSTHLAWGSCITFALLVPLLRLLHTHAHPPRSRVSGGARLCRLLAAKSALPLPPPPCAVVCAQLRTDKAHSCARNGRYPAP
jgi:hypothetical protein